eukprot:6620611-Heterocapsa_arctica.AAC.1
MDLLTALPSTHHLLEALQLTHTWLVTADRSHHHVAEGAMIFGFIDGCREAQIGAPPVVPPP